MAFSPSPFHHHFHHPQKVDHDLDLDPHVWKACAGSSVQIPAVDSRVYYFPQGHAEQSSSPPDFSTLHFKKPFVLCRILAVRFLADRDTDEVFARILLEPIPPGGFHPSAPSSERSSDSADDAVSFAKVLTPSDANNGGGFSVPRFCADSIFPPLNFRDDPPVQNISVRDLHGAVWEFRHIYRGTPRRHLLTTGWSKFVNQKRLVAGDSVVFIKNWGGELFVGVRRARAHSCGQWVRAEGAVEDSGNGGEGGQGGFSRSGRGRVLPESVVMAAQLAGTGRAFEIIYYPRAGSPDFMVRAEAVEDAMKVYWAAGVRVKMAMETEDSSRMTWFQGTVSSTAVSDFGIWRGSPWRSLQISWDEPEFMQNVKQVSPWEVEVISATSQMQTAFPPTKKLRLPQNTELLTDGEGPMFSPVTGLTHTLMGQLNPSLFGNKIFPAGMQGARHNQICVSNLPNFAANSNHPLYSGNLCGNNAMLELGHVSTELNVGNISQSEKCSAQIQGKIHFLGTEHLGSRICNPTKEAGCGFIQLFGQIIQTKRPVETDFDNMDGDISKGCKKAEGGHYFTPIQSAAQPS